MVYVLKLEVSAVAFGIPGLFVLDALFRRFEVPVLNFGATFALCVHDHNLLVAGLEPATERYAFAIVFVVCLGIATAVAFLERPKPW